MNALIRSDGARQCGFKAGADIPARRPSQNPCFKNVPEQQAGLNKFVFIQSMKREIKS
ncbi:hypothetical protein [Neisseria lactamica]|uniref:hypothetical protein n=1 Tax=Neisseria lactamica TaxID=486 RepID=UPI0027E194A9|nr:hypothetical protein [Neisseria lactamica]